MHDSRTVWWRGRRVCDKRIWLVRRIWSWSPGVVQLRPEDATVEAMLRGWRAQQTARGLQEETVAPRERLVRRFVEFTNEYPWHWLPGHVDEWTQSLDSRGASGAVDDPRLPDRAAVIQRVSLRRPLRLDCSVRETFGTGNHPVPICHEWNTITHLNDYEGRPEARAFTRAEIAAVPRLRRRSGRARCSGETQRGPRRLSRRDNLQGHLRLGFAAHGNCEARPG